MESATNGVVTDTHTGRQSLVQFRHACGSAREPFAGCSYPASGCTACTALNKMSSMSTSGLEVVP